MHAHSGTLTDGGAGAAMRAGPPAFDAGGMTCLDYC